MSLKLIPIAGLFCAALSACGQKTQVNTPKAADAHLAQKGWEMVWSDEFNGAALDPNKWTPETSCWGGGNNERQCYTARPDNIDINAGVLTLRAKAETYTGLKHSQDRAERGGSVTQDYTSGKIRTKGLANWKYGRFEARIKLPLGQSTWPAFWMLPEDNSYGEWPLSGEIDIMEAINLGANCTDCENSETENRSSAALHFGQPWPQNQFRFKNNPLPRGVEAYHVFALEWAEGDIHWFVDDQKIFSLSQSDWFTAGASKTDNAFAPFDQPFYLMLNLAVGGNLPDTRNEESFNPSSFPNELKVDWVRVYQCVDDMKTGKNCASSE